MRRGCVCQCQRPGQSSVLAELDERIEDHVDIIHDECMYTRESGDGLCMEAMKQVWMGLAEVEG